ncbi:hypothetical protein ABZV93_05120 [Actinopolymorpha sp. NPDC004070]|uniref:hypothetical protein n=1 Tax=Actinopolymorpha sp. NPDC004070 TaxID=3154548 RepID=UPI0033A1B4CE
MRIVTWMLMGIGAGALAGFVSALLRRRHLRVGEPVAEYAGGYAAPVASEDQTASYPASVLVSGNSKNSDNSIGSGDSSTSEAKADHAGPAQAHRVGHAVTAGRADRGGRR